MKDPGKLDRLDVLALEILETQEVPIPWLTEMSIRPPVRQTGPDGLDKLLQGRAKEVGFDGSIYPVMERFTRLLEGGFVKEFEADEAAGTAPGITLSENGLKLLKMWRARGIPGVPKEEPPAPSRGGRKPAPTPAETATEPSRPAGSEPPSPEAAAPKPRRRAAAASDA